MKLIVAYFRKNFGIGSSNTNSIPWHLTEDLQYFKEITTKQYVNDNRKNAVIMGRKTYESIPSQHFPLKNRINIIISNTLTSDSINHPDVIIVNSFDAAVKAANEMSNESFIIGGSSIYQEALNRPGLIDTIYATELYKIPNFDIETNGVDIIFSNNPYKNREYTINNASSIKESSNGIYYRFVVFSTRSNAQHNLHFNTEEEQYLRALEEIKDTGVDRGDRTGVGTLSVFGMRFKYNLRDTFPLLTTKRMFTRAIFEELALYLSGKTDNTILADKNIHIWDGNTTREFLDSRGLTEYREGDMGETYGFNFRHFGGEYRGCGEEYGEGNGFDQVEYVVNEIKHNPESRRIIINLWNSNTMHRAALPACLCMYQFFVDTNRKELNLQIYIRSSDFFLANNWNTCTGAFLVHMICNLEGVDLSPGDLTVVTGDTHLYKTHIEAVEENLKRSPGLFPKLVVNRKCADLRDFHWEDMEIIGYHPQKNITAQMAV